MEWFTRRRRAALQTIEQHNTTGMALALEHTGRHIYRGTVPAHVKAARRAQNKRARAARRAARR